MAAAPRNAFRSHVEDSLRELGADPALLRRRRLPLFADARSLHCVGLGTDGRDKFLAPPAARAWLAMREAAAAEGVELLLISAFRSFEFQLALIRGKLAKGRAIAEILTVNAPPGCSEHHSGRAVDIGARDTAALEEEFESTPQFAWLMRHANRHGFHLSYPRGNRYGYLYEPWHWCHRVRPEQDRAIHGTDC
ncbi:MAG TPA: M15 family metallopeptidase [Nevskia sp.]|nr:M15 family metallopeptidase [Nevskia sp.]